VKGNLRIIIRKSMSVIVTDPEGKIFLFTKGADNKIREKVTLNQELIEKTNSHLIDFAKKGLRTLMLAYKELSPEELSEWESSYNVF